VYQFENSQMEKQEADLSRPNCLRNKKAARRPLEEIAFFKALRINCT
jgi:hypothetical protein